MEESNTSEGSVANLNKAFKEYMKAIKNIDINLPSVKKKLDEYHKVLNELKGAPEV